METTETVQDLLSNDEPVLIRADTGKRLINYMVDLVGFYVLIFVLTIIVGLISPDTLYEYVDADSNEFNPLETLFFLLLYAVYMGVLEAVFKGKTLGKLITKTRALNVDGSRISVGAAFGRGLSRAVPFAAFSALGSPCNPWHDKWTNTMVVDERQSQLLPLTPNN